ncbi:MAG: PD40 domain-containing protein [Anaerolineales bacterium]|nr:PD40 domain-containing protein [Anaerolineales bacterium]
MRYLLIMCICLLLIPMPSYAQSPTTGHIVFSRWVDGDLQLFMVDAMGSQARQLTFDEQDHVLARFSPDGTQIAYLGTDNDSDLSHVFVMDVDGNNSQQLTDEYLDTSLAWVQDGTLIYTSERDGVSDIYQLELDTGVETQITDSPARESSPTVSPDGRQIVFQEEGKLILLNREDNTTQALTDGTTFADFPAWSPDGQHIAFVEGSRIMMMDMQSGEITRIVGSGFGIIAPRWSPDGAYLVYARGDYALSEVFAVRIADGANYQLTYRYDGYDLLPDWSPQYTASIPFDSDTPRIIYSGQDRYDQRTNIYMTNANGATPMLLTNFISALMPTLAPDGERMAFVAFAGMSPYGNPINDLYIAYLDGEVLQNLTHFEDGQAYFPSWSPDGRFIAFSGACCETTENADIFVVEVETGTITNLTNDPAFDGYPAWSPNGKWIAFASSRPDPSASSNNEARLFVMEANGSNPRLLLDEPVAISKPAWSSDGQQLAVVIEYGDVNVIELVDLATETGGHYQSTTLSPSSLNASLPAWSPDGTQIVFTAYTSYYSPLYIMNANGGGLRMLISDGNRNESAVWVP